MQWNSVLTQGPTPLPRSLHSMTVIKNRLFSFGGWVPVLGEDGAVPSHETEWKCANTVSCLNLGGWGLISSLQILFTYYLSFNLILESMLLYSSC